MESQRSAESLFVDSQLGELPLLLTCPHDGRGAPPGLEERSEEQEPQPGCGRVVTDADLFTRQITLGLSAALEDLTARPFSVIARFRPAATEILAPALANEPDLDGGSDATVEGWIAGLARVLLA